MRNNRNSQKPAARFNESVIDNQFDVRLLNTWEAVSLVAYMGNEERKAMSQTFRFQIPDFDVNMRHILMCVETGRAMDQRFRRDRGVQIDVELKWETGGIRMMFHVVTLFTDDRLPRYQMPARDGEGKFIMEDGKHVMVPATLTFERLFPENRLQKLYDTAEDLMAVMQLRRVRRILRSRGDQKSLAEMGRSLEYFSELCDKPPVERLTASAGDIAANKARQAKKQEGQKKAKIKPAKIAAAPATVAETSEDRTDDLARKLTVGLGLEDPGAGLPTDDEGQKPEPEASASPTPAAAPPKAPKKEKVRPPKLGLADLGTLKDQVLPGASNGSNGQS